MAEFKTNQLKFRLDDEMYQRLRQEMKTMGHASLAETVRYVIAEHFALQEELASAIQIEGQEPTGRIIHTVLAGTEERIGRSLDGVGRRLDRLFERMEMLSVMESQSYLGFLSHTPEVAEQHRAALWDGAQKRHQRWERRCADILRKGEGAPVESNVKEIANDLKQNLEKISHHGKRASGIVKGMLEHSRTGDQEKESTDLNVMIDEYLRLAYHGLRAKDNAFNAEFKLELDPSLPKVDVIPQRIGEILL